MCDVCSTSIFNVHLTCATCGLMVCGDFYTARRGLLRSAEDLDVNLWPLCLARQPHSVERLMVTQMSPASIQETVVQEFHKLMKNFHLPTNCHCDKSIPTEENNSKRSHGDLNSNDHKKIKKIKTDCDATKKKPATVLEQVPNNPLASVIKSVVGDDHDSC